MKIILSFILTINLLYAESFTFNILNDFIANEDKHFTNGFDFTWTSDLDTNNTKKHDNLAYDLIAKVPYLNHDAKYQTLAISFNQALFTPEDTKSKEKITDDMPYAAIAGFDFELFKWSENYFHKYNVFLGMVGPSARGEETQNGLHKIIGANKIQGWDNQLKDDFIYQVGYAYGQKSYTHNFDDAFFDITHIGQINLGNLSRELTTGTLFRYSTNKDIRMLSLPTVKKVKKDMRWAITYGLFYQYSDYFYVTDYDKSYVTPDAKYMAVHRVNTDFYIGEYTIGVNFMKSSFGSKSAKYGSASWAGISIGKSF